MKSSYHNEKSIVTTMTNFNKLIGFCTGLRTAYKPTRADMQIPMLQAAYDDANNAIEADRINIIALTVDGKDRVGLFQGFRPLCTRVFHALQSAGAPDEILKSARTILRKINGVRAVDIDEPADNTAAGTGPGGATTTKHSSASHQGYNDQAEHLARLIELVKSQPSYNPNEYELSVAGLTQLLAAIVESNRKNGLSDVNRAFSRLNRKDKINNPINGIVALGNDTKAYIKSVFGARSPEYREVSKLKFLKDRD